MSTDLVTEIRDYLACYPREWETVVECPLAESLWRIVRRILRTQSKRTCFELRVLWEARRLADSHRGVFTRDLLAKLVVDELLKASRTNDPDTGTVENARSCFGSRSPFPAPTYVV
jgi:hypothetical protein